MTQFVYQIASTTLAIPAVVTTTATPVGIFAGDWLRVENAQDTALNGQLWIAGKVNQGSKTIELYRLAAEDGTAALSKGPSIGTMNGGAQGTITHLGAVGVANSFASITMNRAKWIDLADVNAVVGPYTGARYRLTNTPAAVRTFTMWDLVPARVNLGGWGPGVVEYARIAQEFLVAGPLATGQAYIIKRPSGTTICEFWGNAAGDAGAWAELEYDQDTNLWRLGRNSGGGSTGGVLSGPGA